MQTWNIWMAVVQRQAVLKPRTTETQQLSFRKCWPRTRLWLLSFWDEFAKVPTFFQLHKPQVWEVAMAALSQERRIDLSIKHFSAGPTGAPILKPFFLINGVRCSVGFSYIKRLKRNKKDAYSGSPFSGSTPLRCRNADLLGKDHSMEFKEPLWSKWCL